MQQLICIESIPRSLVARSEATSVTVDRRLSEIQQALSQTQYALMSQATAINCILHSVSGNCHMDCQCGAVNQHQRYHERKHALKELFILAYL